MTATKFALRSFAGLPTKFYRVERDDLSKQAPSAKKSPAHHIFVLDRSGSMYGDMDPMKTMVEKLLTLGEFDNDSLRVSLVSYSSQGDVKLHFKRVSVGEVMKAGSAYVKEIRSIRATAMTCISQGLVMAETLIDDKEMTCISLHTDGWANDRSPSEEARAIAAVVEKLKAHPNAFTNTIAYRGYCDYNLLASIANGLSGVCIQALTLKQVHDALYAATALLNGSMAPALEASRGNADYVTFVSKSARKVLGSSEGLVVRGLGEKDDRVVYRYFEIDEAGYGKLSVPETLGTASVGAIAALARASLSEGRLNAAKYALVATKNASLIGTHARALVSSDVAKFASALEEQLFSEAAYAPTADYGLPAAGPSVLRVLSILDKYAKSLQINLTALLAGYKRRGVKRIPGTRAEDGTVTPPSVESKYRTAGEDWIAVNGFEINRNNATINMLVSQPIDLFPRNGNVRIASVSGVDLSGLKSFNNYTLVGDGSLNVSALMVRTSDKRCFKELKDLKLVSGEYKPNEPFAISFADLPLVEYDATFDPVAPDEIRTLANLTVLSKILSGIFKGESASLTGDQIAELKKNYLSPAMNFSPPTTTEYKDLAEAIAEGKVDTRLSYKIDIGVPSLSSVSKLKSGNEYLARRFTAEFLGKPVEKPTLDQVAVSGVKWGVKKLTAATKLDEIDAISYPIYEGFLGLGSTTEVAKVLGLAGCEDPDGFLKTVRGAPDRDDAVAAVKDVLSSVESAIESFYDRIRPLAFYVGATGLVPDSLDATAYTAEQFATKYPDAKLTKKEKEEGTFFLLPNGLVITVYVTAEHYSTTPTAAPSA